MKEFEKAKKVFKQNEYNLKLYQDDLYMYLTALIEKYSNDRKKMHLTLINSIKKYPE